MRWTYLYTNPFVHSFFFVSLSDFWIVWYNRLSFPSSPFSSITGSCCGSDWPFWWIILEDDLPTKCTAVYLPTSPLWADCPSRSADISSRNVRSDCKLLPRKIRLWIRRCRLTSTAERLAENHIPGVSEMITGNGQRSRNILAQWRRRSPGPEERSPTKKPVIPFCAVLFYLCFFSYWPTKLVNRWKGNRRKMSGSSRARWCNQKLRKCCCCCCCCWSFSFSFRRRRTFGKRLGSWVSSFLCLPSKKKASPFSVGRALETSLDRKIER